MKGIIKIDYPQIITLFNRKGNIIYRGDVYPSIYLVNATIIHADCSIIDLKLNFIKEFIDRLPKREKNVDLKFKDLRIIRDYNTKNFSISVKKKNNKI